jgi:hypothetical protein
MNFLRDGRSAFSSWKLLAQLTAGAAFAVALLPQASCAIQLDPPPPGAGLLTAPGPSAIQSDGGAVAGNWTDITNNLLHLPAICGTLTTVVAKPDEDLLLAGVAGVGAYGSTNGGKSWQPLGAMSASGASVIANRMTQVLFDPSDSKHFWEVGIYGPSPLVTSDDGQSFTSISAGDLHGTDWIGVDFTDPDRKTIVAGSHEEMQILYRSTDGGATWSNIGANLPPNTNCTTPLVVDAQTYVVGCSGFEGGATGLWRTANGAKTWTNVTGLGAGAPPLTASDGSIYWVGITGSLIVSGDKGANWTEVSGIGTLAAFSPVELPGNKLAAVGSDNAVVVSTDQGHTWTPASPKLETATEDADVAHGVAYSKQEKQLYTWNSACSNAATQPIVAKSVLSFPYTP